MYAKQFLSRNVYSDLLANLISGLNPASPPTLKFNAQRSNVPANVPTFRPNVPTFRDQRSNVPAQRSNVPAQRSNVPGISAQRPNVPGTTLKFNPSTLKFNASTLKFNPSTLKFNRKFDFGIKSEQKPKPLTLGPKKNAWNQNCEKL